MSKTILIIVSLAAAGAAGAAVAALLNHDRAVLAPPDVAGTVARLAQQVQDLSVSQARLEADMRELRLAGPVPGTTGSPSGTPAAAPSAPGDPPPGAEAPPDAKLDEKVRAAVAESRAAEMEQIGQRFSAMARRRELATLDRFAESSALSSFQREEVEKVLDRRREAIGAFFRTMFGGGEGDPEAIREKLADVQRETDEAIRALLSPEQYDAWKQVDEAARRAPFGMGMGGAQPEGR